MPAKKRMLLLFSTALLLASLGLAPPALGQEALVVFVSKGVPVESISVEEVKNLFLKKKQAWPGGDKANPINAAEDSLIRAEFRKKVLRMTTSEEDQYWQDEAVRGGVTKPASLGNTQKAVFSLKGAISYAFKKDLKGAVVKVLLEIP